MPRARAVYRRGVTRWQRYWFADGGRVGLAIVRIAVAIAVLMSLARLSRVGELGAPPGVYRPVGIWMLLGKTLPPALLVDLLWMLAWGGSVAMLLGLASRAATAVSFGAGVALASLSFAGSATWSHQYNVVFLAQLALLGGRTGDTLSLDAWIRKLRGLPPVDVPRGYQWSLRLVQLAVALMFAGAAFHKIAHGQFTLRWALSDNLRHHLLLRYDLAGLDRPPVVEWLIDDVWRYRTAALLNLASQLAPIFAVIFVRRPWVRLACGAVFVVEVVALELVVSLWNPHWLPLAAVFVDWDWLLRRPVTPAAPGLPARRIRGFIVAFVVYDAVTAFIPALDQKLNTYPFSGFPMFATIRVAEPYDEHLPYSVAADHFEAIGDAPLDARAQRWLDHHNRHLHMIKDPAKLKARLVAILARVRERYPTANIRTLRHYLTLFETPAYPAPARFTMHPIAITGEISVDGTFRTALGKLAPGRVEARPQGLALTGAKLVYYADDKPVPHELPATQTGNSFAIGALDADPVHVVALVEGQPWLVVTRRSWRWQ